MDRSSPGENWGFAVRKVTSAAGKDQMLRHFRVKHWATEQAATELPAAIEYWAAEGDRQSRTVFDPELLTDDEREHLDEVQDS